MDAAAEGIGWGGAREGRGNRGWMVGMGFSEEAPRGSRLGKARDATVWVEGAEAQRPRGPEAGTSWACSRNRKKALTAESFTSLQTTPRPPEALLLTQRG